MPQSQAGELPLLGRNARWRAPFGVARRPAHTRIPKARLDGGFGHFPIQGQGEMTVRLDPTSLIHLAGTVAWNCFLPSNRGFMISETAAFQAMASRICVHM